MTASERDAFDALVYALQIAEDSYNLPGDEWYTKYSCLNHDEGYATALVRQARQLALEKAREMNKSAFEPVTEREKLLEWKEVKGHDAFELQVGPYCLRVFRAIYGVWVANWSVSYWHTAEDAMVASEDHLATLLEPFAATFEKLRKRENEKN